MTRWLDAAKGRTNIIPFRRKADPTERDLERDWDRAAVESGAMSLKDYIEKWRAE
jgi:hypothetical protein